MAAEAVGPNVDASASTVFDRSLSKEIPAMIENENEKVVAFKDINSQVLHGDQLCAQLPKPLLMSVDFLAASTWNNLIVDDL